MTTREIREKIHAYLVRGEIDAALNLLLSKLDASQQRRELDNVLLLKAQWENLKQEQLRGILVRQEYELGFNKAIVGIQTITNEVDYKGIAAETIPAMGGSKVWLWGIQQVSKMV